MAVQPSNIEVEYYKNESISEKLITIAENEQRVYDAGITEGKQSAYDEFWDKYQQNGKRKDYDGAFRSEYWNDETFDPKHDLKASRGVDMFNGSKITDLSAILERKGFTLCNEWFSGQGMIRNSTITRLPSINFNNMNNTHLFLANDPYLETIDELIVKDIEVISSTFLGTTALKNITISGTISKNFYIQYPTELAQASYISIANALKNYSGTENENVYTVHFSDETKTKIQNDLTAPNGMSWYEYIQSKGWNIN